MLSTFLVYIQVTVQDIDEKTYTALTNENGKIVVPPLNTDMTDVNGEATVSGHKVVLADEVGPIADAYVEIVDGKININLPEGVAFDYTNRITATVMDGENSPVKDMSVTFTDTEGKSETNLTDENGKASVPPVYMDYTDVNGYSEVDGFIVTVVNEIGAIEKAFVTHNAEVVDENGTVKVAENITVLLPEGNVFDYEKRITVTVQNKADKAPVKDMNVIITEAPVKAEGETEEPVAKTLTDKTDVNGKAVFPPLNEDITDKDGDSDVEETPEDKEEATVYKVLVNDTKGVITDALVKIEKGKVTVTLPETHTLTTSNQTTVTVTDSDGKAVKSVSVTVKDKSTSKTGTTDANGKVTLPVKTSSGGGGGSSSGGGGGGGSYYGGGISSSYTTTNIKVVDKDGKTVSVSRTTNANGEITLTLPSGKTVDAENYYTITATDNSGKAKADVKITLKDRNGKSAEGETDSKGVVILPGVTHTAYVFGYPNGEFRPDGDMLRSEAAAIFARLIAERKGEEISGRATFSDVKPNAWYYKYVGYLEDYDVIRGYIDNTFRADEPVSRAEFVAMTVRFYDIFEDVSKTGYTVNYSDVSSRYWAYTDIAFAKNIGWLNGYADGTFKGDNNITRAEVVTVTNHATERTPDEDYINKNVSTLNKFTDLKNNSHWAYYDIMEAANTHIGAVSDDAESWVK